MYITCPACRASLEPDEIDRTHRECPLCSASLADVDLSDVEDQLGDADDTIAGHPRSVEHQNTEATTDAASQVEIIERSAERLVAHLPPTAAARAFIDTRMKKTGVRPLRTPVEVQSGEGVLPID